MIKHTMFLLLFFLSANQAIAGRPDQCVAVKPFGAIEHLPTDIKNSLNQLAKEFCSVQTNHKSSWRSIRITGSSRQTAEQARYIHLCLKLDDCMYYENQQAVDEFQTIHDITVEKIQAKIDDQIKRNCYISKHLSDRAIDIGTNGMPRDDVDRLAALFRSHRYMVNGFDYSPSVVDRTHGTGPHLHINFLPYPFDPKRCPQQ